MRELVVQKDSSQALEQNDWKESKPLFGIMKMCGRPLLVSVRVYSQQLDYFLAQFLNLIIVRRELDGAVSLIVSFCPRSSGIV